MVVIGKNGQTTCLFFSRVAVDMIIIINIVRVQTVSIFAIHTYVYACTGLYMFYFVESRGRQIPHHTWETSIP